LYFFFSRLDLLYLSNLLFPINQIPSHICGEVEPSDRGFHRRISKSESCPSVADDVDELELALDHAYEELEEMDPSTFEAKAGSIPHGLGFNPTMMAKPTKHMSGGKGVPAVKSEVPTTPGFIETCGVRVRTWGPCPYQANP
jgi:hypothetical protein